MTIRYTLRSVRNTARWGVPAGDPGNTPRTWPPRRGTFAREA